MIDHVTIHVSDLERSLAFYAAAFAPLGYQVLMRFPDFAGLGVDGKPDLFLAAKGPVAHSQHVALRSPGRAQVRAFHEAALAAGGTDHGAPGVRPHYHPNYYGAFVLDPDGHNVEACCHEPFLS